MAAMSARRFGWAMLFSFAWRQRRGGIGRMALALASPLLAVLGFALANTIATSAALVTQRDLTGHSPGAYDLLVRPSGDVSEAERTLRLVAPDELRWGSGITIGQWQAIARLPEVEVAAPVAPAGTLRLALPAGAACHASGAPRAPRGTAQGGGMVDLAVVGIDPMAEARLTPLGRALRSGALLPAAMPPRQWLTPPFLLVATQTANSSAQRGALSCPGIDGLAAMGTLGGGLLPPAVDRYVLTASPSPGAVPAVRRADAVGLPPLPGTATSWLSIGSPAGGIDGVVDPARLSLGEPRLDPLPFALYGRAPDPPNMPGYDAGHVLLTDARAICRLLGDGCIGAVRVRVAAPGGINGRRAAVVAAVARAIEQRTGLWVDVTYGAAGRAVRVLTNTNNTGAHRGDGATDLWLAEGATLAISRGVNAINLLLFGLIGALAVLSTVADAVVSGLRRAPERALLRDNGWSRSALRRLTLADTALVGGLAGLLALLLLSLLLFAGWTAPSPAPWAVLPLTIVSYALGAALGDTLARVDRVARARNRGHGSRADDGRLLPWWFVLALRNAGRRPLRATLAVLTAAGAATVFTILLLGVTTLHGLLSVTVLGQGIAVELAPYHAGLAAIAVALTLGALANLGTQGVRERRAELGTLRAVGFSTWAVLRLVAVEAALTAVAGSLLGVTATTLAVVWTYGEAIDRALLGPAILASCAAAAALCIAAAVVPAARAMRVTPSEAQRDE